MVLQDWFQEILKALPSKTAFSKPLEEKEKRKWMKVNGVRKEKERLTAHKQESNELSTTKD